jgi:transposase
MLGEKPAVKIYVATAPVDMRKSFSGLAGAVLDVLDKDPQSGHLFLFVNRRRNLVKVLSWDENGFCLLCKRLSAGVFSLPDSTGGKNHTEISKAALAKLMKARHVLFEQPKVSVSKDGKLSFRKDA